MLSSPLPRLTARSEMGSHATGFHSADSEHENYSSTLPPPEQPLISHSEQTISGEASQPITFESVGPRVATVQIRSLSEQFSELPIIRPPVRHSSYAGSPHQAPRNLQAWLIILTILTSAMSVLFIVMLSSTAFRQMLLGSDALRLVQTSTGSSGAAAYTVGDTQLQVRSDGSLRIGGGSAETRADGGGASAAAVSRAAIQVLDSFALL